MKKINLLMGIDDNYVKQLKTTLYSLVVNSPGVEIDLYLQQKEELEATKELEEFFEKLGINYHPLVIGDIFEDLPTTDRYPETIYYRLLAHKFLPEDLDKILYLDADILVINDITELYEIDLGDNLYGAATHDSFSAITDDINRLRLDNKELESYYNSGVLLMNLPEIRKVIKTDDILDYIDEKDWLLILPDQDVLNGIYNHHIQKISEERYNFHCKHYQIYNYRSKGDVDMYWIMNNTVVLHFCGYSDSDKPWLDKTKSRFETLYKHYWVKANRI